MIYACSITIEDIFLYDNVYNCVILLLRFDLNFVLMCVKSSYVICNVLGFCLNQITSTMAEATTTANPPKKLGR